VPTQRPAPTIRPVPHPTLAVPVGTLVPVPGVVGLKVQQASTVLRAVGFRVQVIGGVLDPERDDRRIVAQRPTPGSVVRAGSTVILVTDGT
jgi:beta-lactam-binding protein with PASTA domain